MHVHQRRALLLIHYAVLDMYHDTTILLLSDHTQWVSLTH